jgi:hypothetical protein
MIIQGCGNKEQDTSKASDSTSTTSEPERKGRDSVSFTLAGQDSVTVFELLQMSHRVEYQSTSMGVFITGIDSIRTGGGGYWVYSVNDTVPKIAADKMFTRHGDTVLWRLRIQGE